MNPLLSELPFHVHNWLIIGLKDFCIVIRKWPTFWPSRFSVDLCSVYCRALTKRSISQNFQNVFFCIIHISLTFSILCQKILAENRLQSSFLGSIKTLYPIFRVGFDNQNTLSNVRVYNTSNLADNLYF